MKRLKRLDGVIYDALLDYTEEICRSYNIPQKTRWRHKCPKSAVCSNYYNNFSH